MFGGIHMNRIDAYIQNILSRTECNYDERNDLFEEFKSHLESAKEDYMQNGYSPKKAEQLAIQDFGKDEQVGNQLQKTIYPYRKDLMLFTGIGTIVFGTFTFLHYTSKFAEPPFMWGVLLILLGAFATLFGFKPSFAANKKILVNCMLVGLNVFYFYGLLLLDTSIERYVTLLNILCGLLILVSLIMIFLTALKPSSNKKEMTSQKVLHIFNLLVGIVVLGWALLFTFGVLVFAGLNSILLMPLGFIAFWVLSYWIQYKMVLNHKAISIMFGCLTIVLPALILYQYLG